MVTLSVFLNRKPVFSEQVNRRFGELEKIFFTVLAGRLGNSLLTLLEGLLSTNRAQADELQSLLNSP